MSKLRSVLEGAQQAQEAAEEQTAKREETRKQIREKLSETDAAFLDNLREIFPTARMLGIEFDDGTKFGRI